MSARKALENGRFLTVKHALQDFHHGLLKAVIEYRRPALGNHVSNFLTALTTYWSTVVDLCNQREHGAQKEGERLGWDDGRRVVLQTLVVMVELDRALSVKA